jgi:hypothetical protein
MPLLTDGWERGRSMRQLFCFIGAGHRRRARAASSSSFRAARLVRPVPAPQCPIADERQCDRLTGSNIIHNLPNCERGAPPPADRLPRCCSRQVNTFMRYRLANCDGPNEFAGQTDVVGASEITVGEFSIQTCRADHEWNCFRASSLLKTPITMAPSYECRQDQRP